MSNPDVSILIVNYHTSDLVRACVESILKHTEGFKCEIIIIDNNSEPDFENKIATGLPENSNFEFKYIAIDQNLGFGKANNEGLKKATGRNILFLNPDTLLLNKAVNILSDFLDTHPEAGACGGNLYDLNIRPTYSYKKTLPGIAWELNELLNTIPQKILYGRKMYFNHSEKPIEVGYITGADLMVRRQVIEKTGGFRKEYFLYYEETDLCKRIKDLGLKIYSVPEAKIMHLESRSFDTDGDWESEFKTRCIEESRRIYYRMNHSRIVTGLSNLIYSMFLYSRYRLIKNPVKREYYKKRISFFKSSRKREV